MDVGALVLAAQQIAGRVDIDWNDRTLLFLREGMDRWARKRPWSALKRTIDLVADGTRFLTLPSWALGCRWMIDETNGRPMLPREHFEMQDTNVYVQGTVGAAVWWRHESTQPVFRQPSAEGYIKVQSTASEAQIVHLVGFVTNNTEASGTAGALLRRDEMISISADTMYTSARQYTEIVSVGRSVPGNSSIDIYDASGLELAHIDTNKYEAAYERLELHPIVAPGTVLRCNVIMRPPTFHDVNHSLQPGVNPHFLTWYAAGLIHKAMGESDIAEQCLARAEKIMNEEADFELNGPGKDWSSIPDGDYWGLEDFQAWPLP